MIVAATSAPHALPVRIEGQQGPLAALFYPPAASAAPRGAMLVLPAFAEEMNRCRSMVSLQARRLACEGVGTLVLDPFGTGDSPGEFVDATWADWRADMLAGVDWLDRHADGCVAMLALRLGALMAQDIASKCPHLRRLMLWQPVLSGKTFYTQFLRIRLAAELQQATRIKSTGELRQLSAQGVAVEVSGYEVGPALAAGLDALAFDADRLPPTCSIDWFEVVAPGAEERDLLPASATAVRKLCERGLPVCTTVVGGPAFWHVHERELAPDLIEATVSAFRHRPVARAAGEAVHPGQTLAPDAGSEQLVTFACEGESLVGCLHRAAGTPKRGVVVVVAGGPQYRAGAHRQFVSLARRLAAQGSPVLRFDLRGMGDSSGEYKGFQHSAPDIRAAVDALLRSQPELQEVLLVGECESASGILFYAWQDARVAGAALVNPWVRSPEGQAQVIVKRYYADRLRSADFWRKVFSGEFDAVASVRSLGRVLRDYTNGRRLFRAAALPDESADISALPLQLKVAAGLSRFNGRVLLLMSGNDYIAREFDEVTSASAAWARLLQSPRLQRQDIADADHTFSRREWKDAAAAAIANWARV